MIATGNHCYFDSLRGAPHWFAMTRFVEVRNNRIFIYQSIF